jgi:hypothetical protein
LQAYYSQHPEDMALMIKTTMSTLFEVYLSSARQALRVAFLQTLVKVLSTAEPATLKTMLLNVAISGYLAEMLNSNDMSVVAGAVTCVSLLIAKLPGVFEVHLRRKGVVAALLKLKAQHQALPAEAPASPSKEAAAKTAEASEEPSPTGKHAKKNRWRRSSGGATADDVRRGRKGSGGRRSRRAASEEADTEATEAAQRPRAVDVAESKQRMVSAAAADLVDSRFAKETETPEHHVAYKPLV